jgi:hypothetical protein
LQIEAKEVTRVAWQGPAEIDGRPWPLQDTRFVLVPGGTHTISTGITAPALRLQDFNGEIRSVIAGHDRLDLSYSSRTRAIALLAAKSSGIEVDGQPYGSPGLSNAPVILPAGQHLVSFLR